MSKCKLCERECKNKFCTRKCAALFGAIKSRAGKTTDIEFKVEEYLKSKGLVYKKNIAVGRVSVADFVLGSLVLYCDGSYWHSTKKAIARDTKINTRLTKQGYTVLRFTDIEIHKEFDKVTKKIYEAINKISI